MSNTYSQIYIHIVFAVQGKQNLFPKQHQEEIHKYISGIVQHRDQKMLAVYCVSDHTHILVGLKPSIAISDLVRDIKAISSKFINEQQWMPWKFSWQEGFGAFSYSRSQIDVVIKYILNQEAHHKKQRLRKNILIS